MPQNYAEAVKWYRLAADQGNADAQNNLGLMYHLAGGAAELRRGREVVSPRRRPGQSPSRSPISAQHVRQGEGVPQDYVRAHMWFNLSAAQGYQDAARNRDNIAKRMTPAQIAEAQKLAREWQPKRP